MTLRQFKVVIEGGAGAGAGVGVIQTVTRVTTITTIREMPTATTMVKVKVRIEGGEEGAVGREAGTRGDSRGDWTLEQTCVLLTMNRGVVGIWIAGLHTHAWTAREITLNSHAKAGGEG